MVVVAFVVGVVVAAHVIRHLLGRPQRAVLVLVALAPFDGLLVLVDGPGWIRAWKEALVAAIVVSAFLGERESRESRTSAIPAWVAPTAGLFALGLISILWTPTPFALAGLKIDFWYVLLPLAIWRQPLTAGDRDRLVTILMTGGVITATIGLLQQWLGHATLNRLGYEYDIQIRTTGGILRSFSTFEQPFPFAFYVVFVLAIGVPVALTDTTRRRNQIFLWLTPLLIVGMVAAIVRAAVLALFVIGVYLVARRYLAVLLAVAVLALGLLIPPGFGSAVASSRSTFERTDGWTAVAHSIVENPFGTGLGTTGAAAEVAVGWGTEVSATFDLPPNRLPYQPDNYYLKRLLELGPIGLWLTLSVLRHAIGSARFSRRRAGPGDAALIDGIVASIVGAIAAAFMATYWEIFPLDLFFWLMLGVLTSIERQMPANEGLPPRPQAAAELSIVRP